MKPWFACVGLLLGVLNCEGAADRNWAAYLGDKARSHYSELDQINEQNVTRLQVAWVYNSGDARKDNQSQIQCNPLVIDGVLYGTTPQVKLVALNAASGKELWRFDPFAGPGQVRSLGVNRGVVFWRDGADQRILFSADRWLCCIDANSGSLIGSFGEQGRVDIKQGLGRDVEKLFVVSTTPGVISGDLYYLPLRVGEGPGPTAPGHIRAYDVRSGRIVWTFNTIPRQGEFGADTWPPEAWRYVGGANCWAGMALDEERGILFAPTGSAAFDFWGGNRIGQNLFGNCLLALNAKTGRLLWHFQFVHHDVWDRDPPAAPTLLTVQRNGRAVDAVAQITKSGHVFVFNRETGEPLFPIEERLAPPSDLQGESTWSTQPFPLKPLPFARQIFSYDEITDISPESRRSILDTFVQLRPHTPFTPPSVEGTIVLPGFDGGGEWGGAAADPDGVLYVNGNEMPWIIRMALNESDTNASSAPGDKLYAQICAACHAVDRSGNTGQNVPTLMNVGQRLSRAEILRVIENGKGVMPSFGFLSGPQKEAIADSLLGTAVRDAGHQEAGDADALGMIPYRITAFHRWFDTNNYPAIKPPWGTMNAIDLNTGEYRWRVPLGEDPKLTARGLKPTGLENYGGPLVTAGELVFIGASKDEMFRAFHRKTGQLLWQTKLPAGGYASPATYMMQGRQFVVLACGGGKMGTKSGDAYVAFALPIGD